MICSERRLFKNLKIIDEFISNSYPKKVVLNTIICKFIKRNYKKRIAFCFLKFPVYTNFRGMDEIVNYSTLKYHYL